MACLGILLDEFDMDIGFKMMIPMIGLLVRLDCLYFEYFHLGNIGIYNKYLQENLYLKIFCVKFIQIGCPYVSQLKATNYSIFEMQSLNVQTFK